MITKTAHLDHFTYDYLTNSQVARIATQLKATATGVTTERVAFDCGETEEPHPGMVQLACQYLDNHRAGRVIAGLRAADWGQRNRSYELSYGKIFDGSSAVKLGEVWSERRLLIAGLSWGLEDQDEDGADYTLLASPNLLLKIFGAGELPANWETYLLVGKRRIAVMGLRNLYFDQATRKHGYLLGDDEAYLLRLDFYSQGTCRSTVQIHKKTQPTITAADDDVRTRWYLVADEAVVIDPSCGYRFGCAPNA